MSETAASTENPSTGQQYVVVARRYRPQTFNDLVGQEHISQALSNAIATNRVGHAYLFTGARGVGKTSSARILAKALNCVDGPTATPCNQCDICQSISGGDDVDVLEIDGASNRGIDEIRQLRQNVNVRPSRARFKIYIIDEVHMLTREAFNALLKTLEEPPEHVKFIFCTTEPNKIPITILSRCQRFDFAGIRTKSIAERLRHIVGAEGVEADDDALQLLARRAAGSMRDSQSLLEQLLAFSSGRITVDSVHGMLGTASDERMGTLVGHLIERNAGAALTELDTAATAGVDVAQLLEQLLGYFRDCMVAAVGCTAESFLYTSPGGQQQVAEAGKRLGLQTILAIMQILDQTLSRMRQSTQGRILAELSLVRICALEDLDELPKLIAQLQSGVAASPSSMAGTPPSRAAAARPGATATSATSAPESLSAALRAREEGAKKKFEPVASAEETEEPEELAHPTEGAARVEIAAENAAQIWMSALSQLSGLVAEQAKEFERVALESPNRLVITLKPRYALAKSTCERPEQVAKFEQALCDVTGQRLRVHFVLGEDREPDEEKPQGQSAGAARALSSHELRREAEEHPLVQRAMDLFGAEVQDVIPPRDKRQ